MFHFKFEDELIHSVWFVLVAKQQELFEDFDLIFIFFVFNIFFDFLFSVLKNDDVCFGIRPYRYDDRCSNEQGCRDYYYYYYFHGCRRYLLLVVDYLCDHRSDYFRHDFFDRRLDSKSLFQIPDNWLIIIEGGFHFMLFFLVLELEQIQSYLETKNKRK